MGGAMTGTGLADVTVVRDGTTLLRDVTLQAADGELMVVLGPSGSGKSTLLRVLAGLDRAESGRVTIKGRDVTGVPARERRVSMVFETSTLIPFLDVSRNLGWGLRMQRLPEEQVRSRVSERVRQLRLGRLLPRRPDELSGGERSLVGIGHAVVATPDVFLFDEPLGNLDAVQRAQVRRQIADVVHSLGVAAFYVTHDQAEGLGVADRVALLHQGRIVQVGRPRDLFERPADLVAAGFVGTPTMGTLPARLIESGGLAGFRVGDRTLPLWRPVPDPLRGHVGRGVVLGLRAEHVLAAGGEPLPDTVALDGVVTEVEYDGRRNVVTLAVDALPGTSLDALTSARGSGGATLRSLFPPEAVVRPGDLVAVAVDATRAHVFDAVTGAALWHPDGQRGRTTGPESS
jgi:multiple sugar transport system ATP-binding protein